jgi:hypothetical protein
MLTLLMIALIGVVLVSAVVGTRNPRSRWTSIRQRLSMSRHAAMGGGDPIGVGNWENEGGSIVGVDDDLPVTIDLHNDPKPLSRTYRSKGPKVL